MNKSDCDAFEDFPLSGTKKPRAFIFSEFAEGFPPSFFIILFVVVLYLLCVLLVSGVLACVDVKGRGQLHRGLGIGGEVHAQ